MVKLLLDWGADAKMKSLGGGLSAIHFAVQKNTIDLAMLIMTRNETATKEVQPYGKGEGLRGGWAMAIGFYDLPLDNRLPERSPLGDQQQLGDRTPSCHPFGSDLLRWAATTPRRCSWPSSPARRGSGTRWSACCSRRAPTRTTSGRTAGRRCRGRVMYDMCLLGGRLGR